MSAINFHGYLHSIDMILTEHINLGYFNLNKKWISGLICSVMCEHEINRKLSLLPTLINSNTI